MRRPWLGVRAGAAVLAGVLLVAACSGGDDSGVAVARAERRSVTEVVDAPATVTARASATVTSPAGGRIGELFVRDGQRVSAGSLIAIIDSPETVQRLRQAEQADAAARQGDVQVPTTDLADVQREADEAAAQGFRTARDTATRLPDPQLRTAALAQVTAAEQRYALARAQAQAAVDAVTSGIGSLADALASLTAAQQAQTAAAVSLARSAVAALVLRAPVAGTVQLGGTGRGGSDLGSLVGSLPEGLQQQAADALGGAAGGGAAGGSGGSGGSVSGGSGSGGSGAPAGAAVAVGAPVSAGTAVATLVDTSALGLLAEVDETDVLLVRPGVRARVDVDAVPGAAYPATVTSVDLAPVTSARGGVSYRVRLRLFPGRRDGRPAPSPRPGMSAVANLEVRTVVDAVTVPASAIVRVGGKDAVWVDDDGVARRRVVELGPQGQDVVAVAEGLSERDRVVVKGTDRVREGQRLP